MTRKQAVFPSQPRSEQAEVTPTWTQIAKVSKIFATLAYPFETLTYPSNLMLLVVKYQEV